MIKKFCDRCNKEITTQPPHVVVEIKETNVIGMNFPYTTFKRGKGSYLLCEACADEVKRFMNTSLSNL